jgi:Velvet factor
MKEVDPKYDLHGIRGFEPMLTRYSTIDISFFILTVDLWDKEGLNEKNLVKHNQVSPSISTATTTAYPPTTVHTPQTHIPPQPFDPANIPNYPGATNTQSNTGYGFQLGSNDASSQMYVNRYGDNRYNGLGYGAAQNGYGMAPANGYGHALPPLSSFQSSSTVPLPYGQPRRAYRDDDINSPQTTGMFTRNLIGSLSTSASLLKDEKNEAGIWFILQDLSVRTEDWFRLMASFVNLGEIVSPNMPGNGQSQVLTKGTAPVLATIFSRPFQVFSAKKFPGVIESTELSKTFAQQGVKIPIRKENGQKAGRANIDDDDEEGE